MDAAASVAALIHVAHRLYQYGQSAYKAREEQSRILDSTQAILVLLERIEVRRINASKNPTDVWYQGLLALCTSAKVAADGKTLVPDTSGHGDGALIQLGKAFALLEDQLAPKHGGSGVRQRWLWEHDKKKIKDLVSDIDRVRDRVDSILQQDQFQLTKAILDNVSRDVATGEDTNHRVQKLEGTGVNTINHLEALQIKSSNTTEHVNNIVDSNQAIKSSIQRIEGATDATNERLQRLEAAEVLKSQRDERRAIIEWLSPLQFRKRQSEILEGAYHIGQEFLRSQEFKVWSEGRPWTLYGYGMPGSGKTILSSIVIDTLRRRFASAGIPVLCMYLNYKEPNQALTSLVGSLLKQLVQFQDDDFRSIEVKRLFRDAAQEASPVLNDLYAALQAEIMTFPRQATDDGNMVVVG
ncbi:MAG: hypothetical protein Q9220_002263 [cf. Caloplaca sp. 1 TL-2023]